MTKVTENNIHIPDSYKVGKKAMRRELLKLSYEHEECEVFQKRSLNNLCAEWRAHNLCYIFGIARERTKDVDLQIPMPWYVRWAYAIVGGIAWLIIE